MLQLLMRAVEMLFKELADQYLAERTFKHSTLKNYNSMLAVHILPAFGEQEVAAISSSSVRLFQKGLLEKTGAARVNLTVQLLKCILKDAQVSMSDVKKLRQPRTKIEPFTDAELEAIYQHVDPHYLPLFQTLQYTGMRPNEAFALTWEDIDFDRKTINIDKGMVDGVEDTPKTQSSERVIPMASVLESILLPLRKATGLVFTSKSGGEIKGDIERIWKRACQRAQVKYRCPYQIRHTWVSKAIMKGVPVTYVSRVLGHSNAGITFKFYARWIDSAESEDQLRKMFN